jgi:hypothetical protein
MSLPSAAVHPTAISKVCFIADRVSQLTLLTVEYGYTTLSAYSDNGQPFGHNEHGPLSQLPSVHLFACRRASLIVFTGGCVQEQPFGVEWAIYSPRMP